MAPIEQVKPRAVLWASTNSHHSYFDTPSKKPRTLAAPSRAAAPPKPILKRTAQVFSGPLPPAPPPREITPPPPNPSSDTEYLASPLQLITDADTPIADQVEAYGKLNIRIRSMANEVTAKGRAVPALQPLINNAPSLVAALLRDISRALEDPRTGEENIAPEDNKKKRGMSDDEARYARGLCTSSMAALRFTGLILASTSFQEVFSPSQIDELLTSVLSIPLAATIPTPNCRKTYALAISVLSLTTLPTGIIEKAAPRMTFAFQRALQGQLGREGKKGAGADSLRAIKELVLQHPVHFFTNSAHLLDCIFEQLLGTPAQYKILASQALGALASVAFTQDSKPFFTTFENMLRTHYQDLQRQLLAALSPEATLAPWALCTMAYVVVLSRGSVRGLRMACAVAAHIRPHKRAGVRTMGTFIWRCLQRLWLSGKCADANYAKAVLDQCLDSGLGLGLVAAHTAASEFAEARKIITALVSKGGQNAAEAASMFRRLVSHNSTEASEIPWSIEKLTPTALFDGTLLGTPHTSIGRVTSDLRTDIHSVAYTDITPLSRTQIHEHWDSLCELWKEIALKADLGGDGEMPSDVSDSLRSMFDSRRNDDSPDLQEQVSGILKFFLNTEDTSWTNGNASVQAGTIKFGFIDSLWSVASTALCSSTLCGVAQDIISMVLDEEPDPECVAPWSQLLGKLAVDADILGTLEYVEQRMSHIPKALECVWDTILESWGSGDISWDLAGEILSFPFRCKEPLGIDEQHWEQALRVTLCNPELNATVNDFLELLSERILRGNWHIFLPRAAELMLGQCNALDPQTTWTGSRLISLCNRGLEQSYRRYSSDKSMALRGPWLLRAVSVLLTSVGSDKMLSLLVGLQPGIIIWTEDIDHNLGETDYEYNVGTLYHDFLTIVEETTYISASAKLAMLAPLLVAPFKRCNEDELILGYVSTHAQKSYMDVPEVGWPCDLRSYIIRSSPQKVDSSITVVSESLSPHNSEPPQAEFSLKRSSPSSDDRPRKRRRHYQAVPVDENMPMTPSVGKKKRTLSGSGRSPLKPLQEREPLLFPRGITFPKLSSISSDADMSDEALLPKLFGEVDPIIDNVGDLSKEVVTWPSSDDTLVGDDSPQTRYKTPLLFIRQ